MRITALAGNEARSRQMKSLDLGTFPVTCPTEYVSVGRAARILGVHPTRVRALIAAGELEAYRDGLMWFVDPVSLYRRKQARLPRGAPFRPENACAVLIVKAWGEPPPMASHRLSRARRIARRSEWSALAPRLRRRASTERSRGSNGDVCSNPRRIRTCSSTSSGVRGPSRPAPAQRRRQSWPSTCSSGDYPSSPGRDGSSSVTWRDGPGSAPSAGAICRASTPARAGQGPQNTSVRGRHGPGWQEGVAPRRSVNYPDATRERRWSIV